MSDKANRSWSAKDSNALVRWQAAGVTITDIARRLGRSVSAINAEASRLGCHRSELCSWSRTQEQQLARFWSEGIPTAKIAKRLVRNPGAVLSKARALGLRRPTKARRSTRSPSIRKCRSCGIKLPTTVPCHRANCNAVAEGLSPLGSEIRTKLSLVSSSMGDR